MGYSKNTCLPASSAAALVRANLSDLAHTDHTYAQFFVHAFLLVQEKHFFEFWNSILTAGGSLAPERCSFCTIFWWFVSMIMIFPTGLKITSSISLTDMKFDAIITTIGSVIDNGIDNKMRRIFDTFSILDY